MSIDSRATLRNFVGRAALAVLALGPATSVHAADACPMARRAVRSDRAAVDTAREAIRSYRLTSLKNECVEVGLFSKDRNAYLVEARAVHSLSCGGATQTAPRLFLVRVGPQGEIASDAGRIDGLLRPVPCPGRRGH